MRKVVLAVGALAVSLGACRACGKEPADDPHVRAAPAGDAAPVETKASVAKCNELWERAERDVAAALPADRACKAASDCVLAGFGGCNLGCGSAAIPKVHESDVLAQEQKAREAPCKAYTDGDCYNVTPRPMASCATPTATCKDGSCALVPWAPH
jgi:hypothetical protein